MGKIAFVFAGQGDQYVGMGRELYEQYAQLFKGNYLTNYSWGEATLSELLGNF